MNGIKYPAVFFLCMTPVSTYQFLQVNSQQCSASFKKDLETNDQDKTNIQIATQSRELHCQRCLFWGGFFLVFEPDVFLSHAAFGKIEAVFHNGKYQAIVYTVPSTQQTNAPLVCDVIVEAAFLYLQSHFVFGKTPKILASNVTRSYTKTRRCSTWGKVL